MKIGDLVKPKNEWKHVRYDPQKVKNRIGIVVRHNGKDAAMVLWSDHGEICYSPFDELEVISESR